MCGYSSFFFVQFYFFETLYVLGLLKEAERELKKKRHAEEKAERARKRKLRGSGKQQQGWKEYITEAKTGTAAVGRGRGRGGRRQTVRRGRARGRGRRSIKRVAGVRGKRGSIRGGQRTLKRGEVPSRGGGSGRQRLRGRGEPSVRGAKASVLSPVVEPTEAQKAKLKPRSEAQKLKDQKEKKRHRPK